MENELSANPTKSYNLMWIPPTYPLQRELFTQPMSEKTATNIKRIAKQNLGADVQLWIDSKRMSNSQMRWLEKMVGNHSSHNLSLQDLRDLSEYHNWQFYNQPDKNPFWRLDKNSLIWRQVDTARLLVCIRDNHDQVFYSDADVTNLVVNSDEVQDKLKKHGMLVMGDISCMGYPYYENGLFGFDERRRDFFKILYDQTLTDVVQKERNGYSTFVDFINGELRYKEKIDTKEIIFSAKFDGTQAIHQERKSVQEHCILGSLYQI